jgi:16S rRNA U516 pseudouridylate synthase RsuA-like enzyme
MTAPAPTGAEPKALYSFTELAKLSGLSRHQVRRLVKSAGMATVEIGRKSFVPLVVLQDACPEVWRAIAARHRAEARGRAA